ncbi:ExeA family protein [Jannaschia sp. KMU-145]|uniref:ExeA family protein n=1 Tax=Jannaschia halovivens TaxID=3388667 RepID=UPI00396B00BE
MNSVQTLYSERFGLTGRPFCVLPDAELSHEGPSLIRAHAALEYGLMTGAPFMALTGEAGTGKTSLLMRLMADADETLRFAVVGGIRSGAGSILPWILQSLGEPITAEMTEPELHSRLQDLLIADYAAGRRVVLVIDEAQTLSTEALDELRLLTNINSAEDQLVQVILSGHPGLRDMLRMPALSGLVNRVGVWAALDPILRDETTGYIAARLSAAGGPEDLFDEDAVAIVHAASAGLARAVNQLCEMALVFALSGDGDRITAQDVRAVLDHGMFVAPRPAHDPAPASNRPARLRLASGE